MGSNYTKAQEIVAEVMQHIFRADAVLGMTQQTALKRLVEKRLDEFDKQRERETFQLEMDRSETGGYTREEATVVVQDHIQWLEKNDRKTVADALRTIFYEMGKESKERATTIPENKAPVIVEEVLKSLEYRLSGFKFIQLAPGVRSLVVKDVGLFLRQLDEEERRKAEANVVPPTSDEPSKLKNAIETTNEVGLTHEEIKTACKNIGVDLDCPACAEKFYTGSVTVPHKFHGCWKELPEVTADVQLGPVTMEAIKKLYPLNSIETGDAGEKQPTMGDTAASMPVPLFFSRAEAEEFLKSITEACKPLRSNPQKRNGGRLSNDNEPIQTTNMENKDWNTFIPPAGSYGCGRDSFNALSPIPPGPIDLGDGRQLHIFQWLPCGNDKIMGGANYLDITVVGYISHKNPPKPE